MSVAGPLCSTVLKIRGNAYYLLKHKLNQGKVYQMLKRVTDLVLCILIAPLIAPLMGLITLLVYLDSPGPVISARLRTGKGGRLFCMYTFRTRETYATRNKLTCLDFKITNKPRITRIGRILRKTGLEELPKLLNVIKGEMSLVGIQPRLLAPHIYQLWKSQDLEIIPGLIYPSRFYYRTSTDLDQQLRLAIAYTKRQSLWLDLKILFWYLCSRILRNGDWIAIKVERELENVDVERELEHIKHPMTPS
jgi:lipopolysaccharide/colanic/teichoic acid biosynthesis glycosyltransferase